MMVRKALVSSLLVLGSSVAQTTEPIENPLPVIVPQFQSPATAWTALFDALPAVSSRIEPFEPGWTYESCLGGPADTYDAYNVFFDDCPEPWQVCLSRDNGITLESVTEMFGKVPVGFRQYVRDLTVSDGSIAYWDNTTIVMTPNFWRIYVMIHEAAHAVDLLDVEALAETVTPIYSSTREWRDAYYSDASAPTTGANSNWVENFAEMGPRAFYDAYVDGGLANFQPNWSEFGNQLSAFESLVGHRMELGGTCSFRIANTAAVPVAAGAEDAGPAPRTSFNSDIRVVQVPHNLPRIDYTD